MSLLEVKVPQLSESISEATLVEWNKRVGDQVQIDEVLVAIETEKIVLDIPSPASGKLVSVAVENGATVLADQVIAVIDTDAVEVQTKTNELDALTEEIKVSPILMPSAEKILLNEALDPNEIRGTGLGGRITKADVLREMEIIEKTPKPVEAVSAEEEVVQKNMGAHSDRLDQRVPMSRLRSMVAERLVRSQQTSAILTTFNEVNMAPVIELRKRYKEAFEKKYNVKLGFMSFFVKAVCSALKEYPIINASVEGSDIVYHNYFDIGIAVASPRGLVVPVLRNADQLSFAEIEQQIADFGRRAKEGKLTIEELSGGTFTISNGGVFGSLFSTPIINPPQSAILGVHATKERPVVENGEIVIRPMNYFALSYDHRIIDGREAVLALVAIKNALEDPARLLLEI
ncbi:MAG: 2-oxoglutarate dehydrogenase complex dihydrolipoyllysine-residue succinyltransferase [Burkholderiaceae bacterium]|nr:2-oxoglutarate dehydrogenase complex dihydrolipoyllysine-residue succinyltransferase [Burkholderiaceae bacterium]